MKRWSLTAVAVALALALAFPAALTVVGQTPSPTATPSQALVRAVHAVPGAGPVNVVTSAGDAVFCNLPFKGVTRYAAVAPGTFNFSIVPLGAAGAPGATGTPGMTPTAQMTPTGVLTPTVGATGVLTPTTAPGGAGAQATQTPGATPGAGAAGTPGSAELTAGQAYSLVAVGQPGNVETLALTDDLSAPPEGRAKVRFVHASPDAPAVDVAVTGAATPLFTNAGFRTATNYEVVDAGTVNLEVRPAGTANPVLTVPNVTLNAGTVYTIYAMGLANGQPPLQAVVTVESVGGMPVPADPTG